MKRELKVKELHVLDAARRRFLGHQQKVKEVELKRMDEQVKKKVLSREKETQAVLQDVETRTIELERQKALLEEELRRCQEEVRIIVELLLIKGHDTIQRTLLSYNANTFNLPPKRGQPPGSLHVCYSEVPLYIIL